MSQGASEKILKRGVEQDHLGVFLGRWHAVGVSFNALGSKERWVSDEEVEWLPGEFFVVQRWDAMTGPNVFKGISIIGYDAETGNYVTRSFENHGFFREYVTRVDGNLWTFTGDTERARVEFADDGDTQRIVWEQRPEGETWLPLCDRKAVRVSQL